MLPGHIVTQTGLGAASDVAWPDGANDVPVGVVGCALDHDMDTAYAIGDMMPVYMTGSMVVVWVRYVGAGGALVVGDLVDTAVAGTGLAVLGTEGLYENLGRITHWHNDIADEQWIKVRLSV